MSDSLEDAERTLRLLHLLAMLGASAELESGASSSSSGQRSDSLKPGHNLKEYVLVAAIDFGTTFSGYAFSFKDSKKDIKMNKNWGANVGFNSYKTPTCVLVDPQKRFKAFGYEAQQEYATMIENNDQKYYCFERFKMKLHNTKDLGKTTLIQATNGKSLPALDIFSMSLKFLKDHLIGAISQAISGNVDDKMIRWVITVPAIWSDASKQFMREAALQAGLIDELDSGHLVVALEPEAASLYVRNLDINQFVSKQGALNIQTGTKYLVIDAGGGTLDVTAHELQSDGRVKELHYATGGALGGTRVDEQFVKLMGDIFGQDFIEDYKRECASNWMQIMGDFEMKKRKCSGADDSPTNIQLSWSLGTKYQDKKKMSVEAGVKNYKGKGVKFTNGMLCISREIMRQLFQPVTTGIVSHINNLLHLPKLQNVEYFFCVGGFSDSPMLQEAIITNFAKVAKILVPEEASLAVVKGAVQFGHAPDSISSRISAKTYGVETMSDFIPFIHDRSKAVSVEGKLYCRDLFETYVKKGQEVPTDFTKTEQFTPVRAEQAGADIEIYSSDDADVTYISEANVEHHGKIHVNWPGKGLDRKLKIAMTFGGTEVAVEATSYPGDNKADTKINFLTE